MSNLPEMPAMPFRTVREALDARAEQMPDALAYCFLRNGEREDGRLTFLDLQTRARTIAGGLLDSRLGPDDRVLLILPQGLGYVAALYACFSAGLAAVPASPPSRQHHVARLQAIAKDSGAKAIVSDRATLAAFGDALAQLTAVPCHALEDLEGAPDGGQTLPRPAPSTVAVLQYTSGSAGRPKGVVITHANVCANQLMLRESFGTGPGSACVTWLPLFHDMGLFLGMMHTLFLGAPCYMMAPLAFLQKPSRWLAAVSRYGAHISGAPNFAYDLCVRDVPEAERAGLDLRGWRCAFNGAETVRADTLARFAAAYGPHGFDAGAMHPCYGLAEATLIAAGAYRGARTVVRHLEGEALAAGEAVAGAPGHPATRAVVSCGAPAGRTRLVIVDPETRRPCRAGTVGEAWLASPSVAPGYWNDPDNTAATFRATLADGDGPYLRTGDLGFVDEQGLFFMTSRLKDVIVIRGRNYSPSDIEQTIERAHPHVRENGVAAFGIPGERGDVLVVAAEIVKEAAGAFDPAQLLRALRAAVAGEHELRLDEVAFVQRGKLPRTTSGKIQRPLCRRAFLAGELALARVLDEAA